MDFMFCLITIDDFFVIINTDGHTKHKIDP
jgi:hypothetical protein